MGPVRKDPSVLSWVCTACAAAATRRRCELFAGAGMEGGRGSGTRSASARAATASEARAKRSSGRRAVARANQASKAGAMIAPRRRRARFTGGSFGPSTSSEKSSNMGRSLARSSAQ